MRLKEYDMRYAIVIERNNSNYTAMSRFGRLYGIAKTMKESEC